MFIICKNYLCYYMTHSCMLGLLSSGAKKQNAKLESLQKLALPAKCHAAGQTDMHHISPAEGLLLSLSLFPAVPILL